MRFPLLALLVAVATTSQAQQDAAPASVAAPALATPTISGNPFQKKQMSPALEAPLSAGTPRTSVSATTPDDKVVSKSSPSGTSNTIKPPPKEIEEVVHGQRIGLVNDLHVFRGTGTYLFERKSAVKVTRKLSTEPTGAGSGPATTAGAGAPALGTGFPGTNTAGLPSMVGKPTPSTSSTPVFNNKPWGGVGGKPSVGAFGSRNTAPNPLTATPPVIPGGGASTSKPTSSNSQNW